MCVGCHLQVEQQRFLVQPFSILTNNHAARASSSMATATSSAGSSAADADEMQEANNLREGYSQHLRQQQLMRQRRRQLALQQQQQQAAYMQHKAAQAAGFTPAEDAARMAAHGYWGSGVTASQAGLLRAGMYGLQQGAAAGLFAPDYNMPWAYKGPLLGAGTEGGGYGVQQHEMMVQGAEGGPQLTRGSSSQGRQQGRLGRMASRIYSLRPRLRKGDSSSDRAPASAAGGAAGSGASGSGAAGLYTQGGASFKSGLSALGAADAAASVAPPPAAAAGAPGVGADGAVDAAAAAANAQTAAAEGAGEGLPLDLTNTPAVLRSVGLPQDTLVVGPQYYIGGPTGPAAKYSSLNHRCVCAPGFRLRLRAQHVGSQSAAALGECSFAQRRFTSLCAALLPQQEHFPANFPPFRQPWTPLSLCDVVYVCVPAGIGASCTCLAPQPPSSCVGLPTWLTEPRWMAACPSLCWAASTWLRLPGPRSTSAGSCRL